MSILVMFVCFVIISILAKLIYEKKNQRLNLLLKQFPSHPRYPLIGNLNLLWNPKQGLLEKFENILAPYERVAFWFGPMPVLLLRNHDDIAKVLSQCMDRDLMGKVDEWSGTGIFTARYKEWKTSRRIFNTSFTSKMHSKYLQVFNKNASYFVENLKLVADTGEYVNVLDWITKANLDSVSENVLGISIRESKKGGEDFCKAVHTLLINLSQRLKLPWLYPDIVYKLYLIISRKGKMIENLNNFPTQILRKKLAEYRELQHVNMAVGDANSSSAMIDLLIKKILTETDISETRIKDELVHMVAGAYETTTMALTFLLLMLAMNQDIQQKVYEEVLQLSTLNDRIDDAVSEDNLTNHLKYSEQCIKETLRMFPPVVFNIRRTQKEILLDDKIIPGNLLVWTHSYAANKDPELYKNPSKWDPEHYSEDAIKNRPKSSDLLFGYGPRSCIGAKYAMMNIKTLIVFIIRKYHLSTNIKELTTKDLRMDLSIRSKLGYPVQFTSRKQGNA